MSADPYVNTGVANFVSKVGTKNKTKTMTTAYTLLMEENSARMGFDMENIGGAGDITIRLGGSGGVEYIISSYGSFSRNKLTGSVWIGEIYAKGTAGGEVLSAEEH